MTGEISIHGLVKPVGGVNAKVQAAKKAGATKIIIPKDNWQIALHLLKELKLFLFLQLKKLLIPL
jgi:Lon-like ATP-dependent protease